MDFFGPFPTLGALLAARTPAEDIARYLLDFPFERLMDGGHALANAGRLQRRLGWFRGDEVERAMRELLDKAGVGGNATLGELEKARKTTLRLSVTDLTRGRHAWLDATRVVGLGASYGGFSMNYLNGNAPKDMFCALVNHDGLFDMRSGYWSTEELFFMEKEFNGPPCAAAAATRA